MQKRLNPASESRLRIMSLMAPIVLPCREATRLISDSLDEKLPLHLRVRVRLHLLLCKWCRRFERQLALMRSLMTRGDAAEDVALPPDAKASLEQEMLRRLSEDS